MNLDISKNLRRPHLNAVLKTARQPKLKQFNRTMLTAIMALGLLLTTALPVFALDGRGGEAITIAEGEVVEDDLYVGAQTLTINGVIKGDLFFGANTVTINGTVEGDVNGGGQSVIINGTVGDDLRVGLTSLTLSEGADVGGDLMMGGFNLDAQSGSSIGGDVLLGAGQARLAGRIAKDLMAGVNGLEILGTIDGDVDASVGMAGESMPFNPAMFMPDAPEMPTIPGGLTLGDSASIGGKLTYSSAQPSDVREVAAGGTTFTLDASDETITAPPTMASRIWHVVSRTIALVLLGLFVVFLFRRPIKRAARKLDTELGSSSLWGIITAICTPIVLLISIGLLVLLATLFGVVQLGLISQTVMSVGIPAIIVIAAGFFLIWGLISKVIVGYWLGQKIASNSESIWMPVLIGLAIVALLSSLPYLGTLVNVVVAVLGLGATWLTLRNSDSQVEESSFSV